MHHRSSIANQPTLSGGKGQVQLLKQFGQPFAKQLRYLAKAPTLAEGGILEVLGLNAQARGDVVTDQLEPGQLVGRENYTSLGLGLPPGIEAFGDGAGSMGRRHLALGRMC